MHCPRDSEGIVGVNRQGLSKVLSAPAHGLCWMVELGYEGDIVEADLMRPLPTTEMKSPQKPRRSLSALCTSPSAR
jgi:hypothetical protein